MPVDANTKNVIYQREARMLLAKGRITKDLIAMLSNWHHSGLRFLRSAYISPG